MNEQLKRIINDLKKGSYPQRVDKATQWIDMEISHLKVELVKNIAYRNHPAFYRAKKITPLEIVKDLLKDLRSALADRKPQGLDKQIACVKREIAMRKAVYAKRVRAGKMKAEMARREYDAMLAVLKTLEELKIN